MHVWLLLTWVQGLIQAAFLTAAEVTQVNWEQREQLLAIYSADLGWHVSSVFSERVLPGPNLGLTFQSLTVNDTGEYFCTYHTYPDGIYKGRIFLKVQESSVAQIQSALLGGAMAAVLGLICLMVTGVTILARKKYIRMHSMESGLGRMAAGPQAWNLGILSSPRDPVEIEAAPAGLRGEQPEDIYAEPQDYFNVLSYRSLDSVIVPVKTG